jgi:hypothetical protein
MMTQPLRRAFNVALAIACAVSFGCSFSHSSKGSSDSSKSSSDSSGSSSGGKETALFQKDVEQYTEAFVEAGGRRENFFTGLGDLARKRGVSDWEAEPGTWESIGRGLGRTQVNDAQRTAFETAWADGDPARQSALAQGFATTR